MSVNCLPASSTGDHLKTCALFKNSSIERSIHKHDVDAPQNSYREIREREVGNKNKNAEQRRPQNERAASC